MSATKTTPESVKQIQYLAGALKAPRITEAATRLADQARDANWSFEDYLAAVLGREVSARNASGARLRVRAGGLGAVKTLEDFDFDAQPAIRPQIAALGSGGFLSEARNIVLLGPPGTGRRIWRLPRGMVAARLGQRVVFATATDWVTRLTDAHRPAVSHRPCPHAPQQPRQPRRSCDGAGIPHRRSSRRCALGRCRSMGWVRRPAIA